MRIGSVIRLLAVFALSVEAEDKDIVYLLDPGTPPPISKPVPTPTPAPMTTIPPECRPVARVFYGGVRSFITGGGGGCGKF